MASSDTTSLADLAAFLERLSRAHIHYSLTTVRNGAIMVQITVPGERWEVEFFQDRPTEVEIFRSDGRMAEAESLEHLFREYGD